MLGISWVLKDARVKAEEMPRILTICRVFKKKESNAMTGKRSNSKVHRMGNK